MNINQISKNLKTVEVSPNVTVLVSYATPVAAKVNGVYLTTSTHYSQTTSRHINGWLGGEVVSMASQQFFDELLVS